MSILDKAKIGNSVKVNLDLSRDRLTKDTIETINFSSVGIIKDFRITDGKGIGVVLEFSNGEEQWFFENEINIIDENGNIKEKVQDTNESNFFIFDISKNLQYQNKKEINELLNPLNFFMWVLVSFKDILLILKNFS